MPRRTTRRPHGRSYFEFDSLFGVYSKNFPDTHCPHHTPGRPATWCERADRYQSEYPPYGDAHSRSGSYAAHLSKTESSARKRLASTRLASRRHRCRWATGGMIVAPMGLSTRRCVFFGKGYLHPPEMCSDAAIIRVDSRRLVWLGGPGDGRKSITMLRPPGQAKTPVLTDLSRCPPRTF